MPSTSETTSKPTTSYATPDMEVQGMVENLIRNKGYILENDVPVIHKTGELLANMHIVLVKKILTLLKKNQKLMTSSDSAWDVAC